ncbi:response regulator [Isoptericola cucumis]|uniref:DNA-binding response regulator n=1 Tax=Isoptericola cucumis TaxID=1776856 RepID=A0ABQ2BB67_9MICO|nr:response regulator transcription factor [Isoptericola cucumis]GGI10623.1 DNA-binding response regulator [Isoptericola cucumis]
MTVDAGEAPAIRVVLVDDQELVRAGLRPLAEHDGDITVVGEAADGRAGLARVRELRPDVVLMDVRMPLLDGIEATRAIVADPALRGVRVLVLTTFDEDEHVVEALRAGAAGYLLKDVSPGDLRAAVRTVAAGDSLLAPAVTATVMRAAAGSRAVDARLAALVDDLTGREREVLERVGRGLTNDEIARDLYLSPATARTYVSRLLTRLDARDRAALVVLAYESGLVRPGG